MIGVSVEQVQRDWDVVVLTPIWHRDCALVLRFESRFSASFPSMFLYLNVDEVPLLAIIESEFVFLGSQSLVVVEQGLNLFCQVNQSNRFLGRKVSLFWIMISFMPSFRHIPHRKISCSQNCTFHKPGSFWPFRPLDPCARPA